jgi:HK97 family phage prohead protease
METCLERAEADGRPPGTDEAIREWFEKHPTAPKGAFFMPSKGEDMNIKTKTVDLKADEANGSITGYAATFIREPDSYGDVIAQGAFAESIERIKAEGKALPLLWNHDSFDLKSFIGTVTELSEDDHGLLFTATFDSTDEAQRARELAADGRLCKLSFAYNVLDQGTVTLEDGREANELRKLEIHEVSLVMYPANPDTSVLEVKSGETAAKIAADFIKAGRRNSAKDADDLNRIKELCGSIESIVNGLLADAREEPDEQEPEIEEDGAKANAEEPRGANAEEPEAKGADVDALLQQATEILTTKEG